MREHPRPLKVIMRHIPPTKLTNIALLPINQKPKRVEKMNLGLGDTLFVAVVS